MPLEWSEVNGRLKLERFNIRSARKRLQKQGDPMAGVLAGSSDMLAALESLTRKVASSA
jgi:DNA primase